jgi:hypothetical protein
MAYTERYVGATLSGDGSGDSVANCWDWATALTSLPAGGRLNQFEDITYNGNHTFTNSGTQANPMAIRGVQSDGTPFTNTGARTNGGALTTSFPTFTNNVTGGNGLEIPGVCDVSGIHFRGSGGSAKLIGEGGNYITINDCVFTSDGVASLIDAEVNYCVLENCDFNLLSTGIGVNLNRGNISYCRFVGTETNTSYALTTKGLGGAVSHCQFLDVAYCISATAITLLDVQHCSFRNCENAIYHNDTSSSVLVANNVAHGTNNAGSEFYRASGVASAKLKNNAVGNFADADQNRNDWEERKRIALSADPFTSSSDLTLNDTAGGGAACRSVGSNGNSLGAIQASSSGGGLISHRGMNGALIG